jgi:hypothetical protein
MIEDAGGSTDAAPGTAQGLGMQLERVKTGAEDHDNDRGGKANKRCI